VSTEATSVFENLEARLKPNRNGALRKISERIQGLEQLRVWFVIVGVLGAFLAALAKAFDGTVGTVLVFVGATLAGVGAAFVARFDFRKLELTTLLTEAEEIAEEAIEAGRKLQDRQSSAALLDRRRLALIDANTVMREALEQALLIPEADPVGTVDVMIEMALRHLLVSIGLEQEEEWVISVFQVQGDELVRVSAKRALRADEQKHSRRWKMNQGAVGAAWARQDVVVMSDGQDGVSMHDVKVPAALQKPYDGTRYRSMAAVPVRLGDPVRIWGVVAVSSDRPGRFRRLPGDRQEQAVDTVRLIARMTALMAAAFERSH
jgi:hypothetical protein